MSANRDRHWAVNRRSLSRNSLTPRLAFVSGSFSSIDPNPTLQHPKSNDWLEAHIRDSPQSKLKDDPFLVEIKETS
jgi:hypothetical protein